jgi:uncharacterized protein (TIGR03000 family)
MREATGAWLIDRHFSRGLTMGKVPLQRIAFLLLGTAVFSSPTPAQAQAVFFRPGGLWGGYGGWGGPYSPGWGGYGPGGVGGYGGANYPGYFGGYASPAYGGYAGLYNYGGILYPNTFQNITTPGWSAGPMTGDVAAAMPRMRTTVTPYPSTSVVVGNAFVGSLPAGQANERAVLDVTVPYPGAEVLVQGVRTTQTGTQRRYVSPPLAPGKDFVYSVRARWRQPNGEIQLQQQNVIVQAGSEVRVAFPTAQ